MSTTVHPGYRLTMPLIRLFSAPKPFTDPTIAMSQRNAIGSWTHLPDAEVLLLGDEPGLADAARQLGVRHLPQVALNPNGVPLVSSMLELARQAGDADLLCIINADILLTSRFVEAARQVLSSRAGVKNGFVLVSRRWDLDVTAPLDFSSGWEVPLEQAVHEKGRLHRPTGSDFFLFPPACYTSVPDFAIGRAGWDNWMIYEARREGWAVIDATASMLVVHQNHDYRHLPGARPHYDHPDTLVNTRLAGGQAATRYSLLDATHVLVDGRLERPELTGPRFWRGFELLLRRIFFFLPEPLVESIARPQRWNKRIQRMFGKGRS